MYTKLHGTTVAVVNILAVVVFLGILLGTQPLPDIIDPSHTRTVRQACIAIWIALTTSWFAFEDWLFPVTVEHRERFLQAQKMGRLFWVVLAGLITGIIGIDVK